MSPIADLNAGADALIAIIAAFIPLAIWAFRHAEPQLQALRRWLVIPGLEARNRERIRNR